MKDILNNPIFYAVLGGLFFIPFLGGVHLFDWDEINFAEIAREMIVLNSYLETHINYEIFTEKPPLFMWLQAASMHIFGIGDFAARFPNAIVGVLVLPIVFLIGKNLHNARFGFYWAMAWFGSILPHLYFKSGIIDPVFNFFIFLGIYFIIKYTWAKNEKTNAVAQKSIGYYLIFAGIFTGLAVLTKGPVAILISGLVFFVFFVRQKFKLFISVPHIIVYTSSLLAVVLLWASVNYLQHGSKFIVEFTIRQWTMLTTPDAGHGGFPGYHFVVLLIGCFPASIFAIQALIKKDAEATVAQKLMKQWMIILFWVVLILFTLVTTKIVHYSSMAYYPLTYLAALSLYQLEIGQWKLTGFMKFGLWFIGGLAAFVTIALPYFGMHITDFKFLFEADKFAAENINAEINWTGLESVAGFFLLAILVYVLVIKRTNLKLRFAVLFGGMGVWMLLTLIMYIAKVEAISQRAAIEFWEARQGEDCYVTTFDYKSYAHIYYARTQAPSTESEQALHANQIKLLMGEIDKPVYISSKVTSKERFENEIKDAEFLYSKNGFYFYRRMPKE